MLVSILFAKDHRQVHLSQSYLSEVANLFDMNHKLVNLMSGLALSDPCR